MHIETLHLELFDTLVAPFWSAGATTFHPLDQESPKSLEINFWGLMFESMFDLNIYHILSIFCKAHVGGLAPLLGPRSKPTNILNETTWSQMGV